MAAAIETARPDAAIELHGEEDEPGMFDVVADGQSLWSKHETGTFPEHDEIVKKLPPPKKSPGA